MTDLDRLLLDTYARHAADVVPGRREAALRDVSGLSVIRAVQRLRWLLEDPSAWEYAPVTMALIRRRAGRSRAA